MAANKMRLLAARSSAVYFSLRFPRCSSSQHFSAFCKVHAGRQSKREISTWQAFRESHNVATSRREKRCRRANATPERCGKIAESVQAMVESGGCFDRRRRPVGLGHLVPRQGPHNAEG